jgi:hypothetical protein
LSELRPGERIGGRYILEDRLGLGGMAIDYLETEEWGPVFVIDYVDGTLRGLTPLRVQLPAGQHSVRVGSPRLEHWRAAEVLVKDNVEHDLDLDLSE